MRLFVSFFEFIAEFLKNPKDILQRNKTARSLYLWTSFRAFSD